MKRTNKAGFVPALITTAITAVLWFFLVLPPINIKSQLFWFTLLMLASVFLFVMNSAKLFTQPQVVTGPKKMTVEQRKKVLSGMVIVPLVLVLFIGWNTPMFRASAYSRLLTVQDGTEADIPVSTNTETIALMDTDSAKMLGDRKLGTLTSVVSQFELGGYMQLNYQNKPVKASPLEYAGLIKWFKNKSAGVPGYVTVDPVKMEAGFVSVKEGMQYVPSAYFMKDLARHIYLHYPTAMLYDIHFEIDEEGNPWYVAPVYTHTIGLFGGTQITGAIVVNPVDGSMNRYSLEEIPGWVDIVFSGDLLCDHYNCYAQYQQGFINSIIGQAGCKKTTSVTTVDSDGDEVETADYGYLAIGGDIWIYTGVTSVNGDSSNLGFILSNERTAETKFISCAGADERSAMSAAEGEVQEKRYIASFPSLITVDGQPTYIMVLKDRTGLVKMYAAVNVEQYNLVVTDADLKTCLKKYTSLVGGEPVEEIDDSAFTEKTITVTRMASVVQDGNTILYIADENGKIYHAEYAKVIEMMLVNEGDTITITTDGTQFRYN